MTESRNTPRERPRRPGSRPVHWVAITLFVTAFACYFAGLFEVTAGLAILGLLLELAAYVACYFEREAHKHGRRPD